MRTLQQPISSADSFLLSSISSLVVYALDDYDFDLPASLIAQRPAERRDASRMLVVNRAEGTWEDRRFADLPELIQEEDALVLNNTRVIPARLRGTRRPGGGAAEVFLIERLKAGVWRALVRPGRKLREGAVVTVGDGRSVQIEAVLDDGSRRVRLLRAGRVIASPDAEERFIAVSGQVPLPPYIERDTPDAVDRERYQTVYATTDGAVAAPTAGLHFTPAVMDRLRTQRTRLVELTLHVGYGTFEPVRASDLRDHEVAPEWIEVTSDAVESIRASREAGGRVVAVGTTSTRALESAATEYGLEPVAGTTNLTVRPGYSFRVVDGLLTNFHLPRSSLLVLVATFGERELILDAYRHAVREEYRFYSYGDCMLIL